MLEYLKTCYTTVRNLLKYRDYDAFELFKSDCLSKNFDSHDNWNGGIDYFTILPTSKYVEIEGTQKKVAHEDIEPSKEWVSELYNALFSMDALCAIIVNGFKSSRWRDQEVGMALGQNKLCIPINKEINPYGFLGRYQVLKVHGLDARSVALQVAEIIFADDRTHGIYCRNIIRLFLNAKDIESAFNWIKVLNHFDKVEKAYIEMLWKNYPKNTILLDNSVLKEANKIFTLYGLSQIQLVVNNPSTTKQEEPPF